MPQPKQKKEPAVPDELLTTQQWFSSIITRPIDHEMKINPISPTGQEIREEAKYFITPNKELEAYQRIEIYNQQYWFRLLSVLHDFYPLVVRLFGYRDFNESIAMPYLGKYYPDTWSLNPLGARLPKWIEEEYPHEDKKLVLNAASIDNAYHLSFLAKELPPLRKNDLKDEETLLNHPLVLQPHIFLFKMEYHLFRFRNKMLNEDVEYWIDNDFPDLEKERTYHFVLYRNPENQISWEEVDPEEFTLLEYFQSPSSISSTLEKVENDFPEMIEKITPQLASWFEIWSHRKWLSKA